MKKELCIKEIFNDFINKVILSEIEEDILTRYIKNESIVKMAQDLSMGTATISRIIADLKEKYEKYKKIEIARLKLFKS